jgi:hypothetical protein
MNTAGADGRAICLAELACYYKVDEYVQRLGVELRWLS